MLEALVQVIDEADDRDREGEVGVGRRRLHPRNQAKEIRRQNEHEERTEKRHVVARAVALEHAGDEAVEPLGYNLGHRAKRNSGFRDGWVGCLQQRAPRHEPEDDQDAHRDPGANHDRRKMQDACDAVDEINRVQTIASAPRASPYAARAETRQVSIKIAPSCVKRPSTKPGTLMVVRLRSQATTVTINSNLRGAATIPSRFAPPLCVATAIIQRPTNASRKR